MGGGASKQRATDLEQEIRGVRGQLELHEQSSEATQAELHGEHEQADALFRLQESLQEDVEQLRMRLEEGGEQASAGEEEEIRGRLSAAKARLDVEQQAVVAEAAAAERSKAVFEEELAALAREEETAWEALRCRESEVESMRTAAAAQGDRAKCSPRHDGCGNAELQKRSLTLEVVILSCEFAVPLAYYLRACIQGSNGKASVTTDVAAASLTPSFSSYRLQLAVDAPLDNAILELVALAQLVDPVRSEASSNTVSRNLGETALPLNDLGMHGLATASPGLLGVPLVREVKFLRAQRPGGDAGRAVVGRAQLTLQLRLGIAGEEFTESPLELAGRSRRSEGGVDQTAGPDSASLPAALRQDFSRRGEALQRASLEVGTLRRELQRLVKENEVLRSSLHDQELMAFVPVGLPCDIRGSEHVSCLAWKLQRALLRARDEKNVTEGLRHRLGILLQEASEDSNLKQLALQRAEQRAEVEQRLDVFRAQVAQLPTFQDTVSSQRAVISRLEALMEKSLDEVRGAQAALGSTEHLKLQNARLREEYGVAIRPHSPKINASCALLRKRLAGSQSHAEHLAAMVAEQAQHRKRGHPPETKLAALIISRSQLEDQAGELRNRCSATDGTIRCCASENSTSIVHHTNSPHHQPCAFTHRIWLLQQQLSEASRRYSSEVAELRAIAAQRDELIRELEQRCMPVSGGLG